MNASFSIPNLRHFISWKSAVYTSVVLAAFSLTPGRLSAQSAPGCGGGAQYDPDTGCYVSCDPGAPSSCGGAPTNQPPSLTDQQLSMLNSILSGLQSTAQSWANAIADYKSGATTAISNFFQSYAQTVDNSLTSVLTRVGGVVVAAEQGFLDPGVAQGIQAIVQQANNPEAPMNINEQRQMNDILQGMDCLSGAGGCPGGAAPPPPPVVPTTQNGAVEQFNTPVQQGQMQAFDPVLAIGYGYKTGSADPNFASVLFPYVGTNQSYEIDVLKNGEWVKDGVATPWTEYVFSEVGGVNEFRVVGINTAGATQSEWVSGLSFKGDGYFTGTITSLPAAATAPEPGSISLICIGFAVLACTRVRQRRKARLASENEH